MVDIKDLSYYRAILKCLRTDSMISQWARNKIKELEVVCKEGM